MIALDSWQQDFINYKGHKVLVAGRQTGKSECSAYDNAEFAANNPGTNCLIISKTQRQSEELLIKTLNYLLEKYPKRIGKGKLKPLKHSVWVMPEKKGQKPSRIMCQPTGLAGEGIRGYTIHKLSVDECQAVGDDVMTAVTPMLLTTGGFISLTGTPKGRQGYFWNAFENKTGHFKVFHVNSLEVIKNRPISKTWQEWRREDALNHLKQEQQRMTEKQFRQEYMGEFIEDLDSVFSDELIANSCVLFRGDAEKRKLYLGVDVGRTTDPTTLQIISAANPNRMMQVESFVYKELTIPQTVDKVKQLHSIYNFKKMGIDGGGLGSGVVDMLMMERSMQEKVKDLNNATRLVDVRTKQLKESQKKKTLLKEQMYFNLQSLMHQGKIKLLADEDIKVSLRSCQMEYKEDSDEVMIYGNDTHIAEGLIRAAWLAVQEKSLDLWAA